MSTKTRQRLLSIIMWAGMALIAGVFLWPGSPGRALDHFFLPVGWVWVGLFHLLGVSPATRNHSRTCRLTYGLFCLTAGGITAALYLLPLPHRITAPIAAIGLGVVLVFMAAAEQREKDS